MNLFVMIFIGWLMLSVIVAMAASSRGRSAIAWFGVAVLISPLFALIAVLVIGPPKKDGSGVALQSDTITCPHCAEMIKRAALVCRFCGHDISSAHTLIPTEIPGNPKAGTVYFRKCNGKPAKIDLSEDCDVEQIAEGIVFGAQILQLSEAQKCHPKTSALVDILYRHRAATFKAWMAEDKARFGITAI